MRLLAILVVCGILLEPNARAQDAEPKPATKISHFSGKPVPRFESLRFPAVHGRIGPSLDHPIAWKYEREGLPVLILKESRDWRFVRDPDGDEVWVHARMLSAARTVLVKREIQMKRDAGEGATSVALLKEGVLAELKACTGAWCEISADRLKGFVPRQWLWGSYADEAGL